MAILFICPFCQFWGGQWWRVVTVNWLSHFVFLFSASSVVDSFWSELICDKKSSEFTPTSICPSTCLNLRPPCLQSFHPFPARTLISQSGYWPLSRNLYIFSTQPLLLALKDIFSGYTILSRHGFFVCFLKNIAPLSSHLHCFQQEIFCHHYLYLCIPWLLFSPLWLLLRLSFYNQFWVVWLQSALLWIS